MRVHYFQRLRRPNANYSLEFIFDDVRSRLKDRIEAHAVIAPCYSNGLTRRVLIAVHALLKQGEVNHVTGDITFVVPVLDGHRTLLTMLDCGNVLGSRGLKRFLLKSLWLDLPVRHATLVTTISEQARREILELTGCEPEKVVVVPVAISDRFVFTPKPALSDPPRILAVGTSPNKNLKRLIPALEGIACILVMIGTPLQGTAELLRKHRVVYETHVGLSAAGVREQYERADVVAFASTYEGFGMPILEGQAVGRPVVTSNVSSMPEVAGDGALLVDPLDIASIREGILRVLSDADLRASLVERGRKNVERFNSRCIAAQYLSLYEEVARRAAAARRRTTLV